MSKTTLVFAIFNLLASFRLFAHGGHDHSEPMAGLIHLLWLAPIVIAAFIAFKMIRQNRCSKDQE